MPRVELELLPKFQAEDVAVLAVLFDPFVPSRLSGLEEIISYPMLIDAGGDGQAVFGSPIPSYPRNVVLDREGKIIHFDLDGNLEMVEAAINAELANESRSRGGL